MTPNLSECSSNISFGKSLCCGREEGTEVPFQGSLLEGRAKELTWQPRLYVSLITLLINMYWFRVTNYSLIYIYVHVYIHTYIYTYVCTYMCTYVYTHIHTYVYIYICTHICTNTYIKYHTHTYIFTHRILYILTKHWWNIFAYFRIFLCSLFYNFSCDHSTNFNQK